MLTKEHKKLARKHIASYGQFSHKGLDIKMQEIHFRNAGLRKKTRKEREIFKEKIYRPKRNKKKKKRPFNKSFRTFSRGCFS